MCVGMVTGCEDQVPTDTLHHEVPRVVADRIRFPAGVVEQALDAIGTQLPDALGIRPAVLPLQRRRRPVHVLHEAAVILASLLMWA